MSRRVALAAIANDVLPTIIARLPANVTVTAKVECFDKAITTIRLEGDGLPDWCAEQPHGAPYVYVGVSISNDGNMRMWPLDNIGTVAHNSTVSKLLEGYKNWGVG